MANAPRRIRLSRAKGWRMPENTVRVSRPGKWGNPFDFRASDHAWTALAYGCRGDARGRQEASVKAFREWIVPGDGKRTALYERQVGMGEGEAFVGIAPRISAGLAPSLDEVQAELRGKNLACWCALDAPCHADVLLELANAPITCEAAP